MATVAFSPIHTWLSRPCSTHNLRAFSTSAPRSQVPRRALTYPVCQSLPSDSFSSVQIEIPYTQNVTHAQAPRRTHNRRRSASLNDSPSAITPDQHANLLNDRPSIFNIATGQVLFSFLPRHSALFSLLPFTPRNDSQDDGIPAHDYTDNTPLPLVNLVAPLPPALIGLRTNMQSAPISSIGHKIIPSFPQDIKCLNDPDLISLRIIEPISTANCLLLLSVCKGLQHLDVVIDREEASHVARMKHSSLLTLRIYASCRLSLSLFPWITFPGQADTEIFWDSRVSQDERMACASILCS